MTDHLPGQEGPRLKIAYAEANRALHRFMSAGTAHFKEAMQRLIVQNEIYLVSRLDLNDPFDMHPKLYCDWTTDGIRQHMTNIFDNPLRSAAPANIVQHLNIPREALKSAITTKQLRPYKQKYFEYMNELLDTVGICCFTEGLQNPLFWAHYANSYRGVCVELRTTSDLSQPFCNCMKVAYTNQRPTILASQTGALATVYNEPDWDYISQYGFCTKSKDWAVEKEWRFWVPHRARTYQSLPERTVRSIFLGPRSDGPTRELVKSLVRSTDSGIKVFETAVSEVDFQIEIAKRLL